MKLTNTALLLLLSLTLAQQDEITYARVRQAASRILAAALSGLDVDVDRLVKDSYYLFGDILRDDLLALKKTKDARFADRHAKRMNQVENDYDCMEREFDFNNIDTNEAAAVFNKCRLLVVRNVFSQEVIERYKRQQAKFLSDLHLGRIPQMANTTHGEKNFHAKRGDKRYDVLMPQYLATPDIVANEKVLKLLGNPKVLGPELIALSAGTVIAESGAQTAHYHYDDKFLFGGDSFENLGIAGGDLPPFAVSMFFPLLNMTKNHGPTEFCMGTNHYPGLTRNALVWDERLAKEGTPFRELEDFFYGKNNECPEKFRRAPVVNEGDAVLWDYTITHRGTANLSPDLRAMAYVAYSRPWYRDNSNFADQALEHIKRQGKEIAMFERLTQFTRFAVVEENDCSDHVSLESIQNFMNPTSCSE